MQPRRNLRWQHGTSLLEMSIVILLSGLLLSAMFNSMSQFKQWQQRTQAWLELQKVGRLAIGVILQRLKLVPAGYAWQLQPGVRLVLPYCQDHNDRWVCRRLSLFARKKPSPELMQRIGNDRQQHLVSGVKKVQITALAKNRWQIALTLCSAQSVWGEVAVVPAWQPYISHGHLCADWVLTVRQP